jgi:hypothetical protein
MKEGIGCRGESTWKCSAFGGGALVARHDFLDVVSRTERRVGSSDHQTTGFGFPHGVFEFCIGACKSGRLYDVEAWIAQGRPLQATTGWTAQNRRRRTPLATAITEGNFDLARLLLCNGYRIDLEPSSPLNQALEMRRPDFLDLLLDRGADPAGAATWHILDTYQRPIFERFRDAGVDLTAGGNLSGALASSTRNRPLYGFVKNTRNIEPRIQRALDVAPVAAIRERSEKAMSLCLWAGANPRHRVGEPGDDLEADEDGT